VIPAYDVERSPSELHQLQRLRHRHSHEQGAASHDLNRAESLLNMSGVECWSSRFRQGIVGWRSSGRLKLAFCDRLVRQLHFLDFECQPCQSVDHVAGQEVKDFNGVVSRLVLGYDAQARSVAEKLQFARSEGSLAAFSPSRIFLSRLVFGPFVRFA